MGSKPDEHPTDAELILAAATAIRDYLTSHPEAADELEGIRQWWIGRPDEHPLVMNAALELLTEAGIVERVEMARRVIWRRARGNTPSASD